MKRLSIVLVLFATLAARAAEVIPPKPKDHFNDYASVLSQATRDELNKTLEDFERATSSQIVVAIFPKMQSSSSIEDYTVRVAQSWGVGQKDRNNGAVLFVFTQDRQMFLQVGYGLEGALPDALCKQIIENEIVPGFKNGDYDGGLRAGVHAILAAARGEYTGTGRTKAQANQEPPDVALVILLMVILLIFAILFIHTARKGRRRYYTGSGWYGGSYSGGGSSGGGGSFSSGGGSFGGGGAGGRW